MSGNGGASRDRKRWSRSCFAAAQARGPAAMVTAWKCCTAFFGTTAAGAASARPNSDLARFNKSLAIGHLAQIEPRLTPIAEPGA